MSAPLTRCLAVEAAVLAVATTLVAWLLPITATPAPGFDAALVRLCAATGALAAGWLAVVATAVTTEALLGGRWRAPGVPGVVRRVLLAACGVAVAAGLTAPAGVAAGRQAPPQTAASVVASTLAGLPLPDRPHGVAEEVVTVRPGDTLWQLAEARLGDGARWTELYAANRAVIGADPDLIRPAQRLRIPDLPPVQQKESR